MMVTVFGLLLILAGTLQAEPGRDALILPGLDPLLLNTQDPRLLGIDRLVIRARLLELGSDPVRGDSLPTIDTRFHKLIMDRINVDMVREDVDVEINGMLGIETTFRYPSWFFLYQRPRPLPGGFIYYPPRNVDSNVLDLFIDDVEVSRNRRLKVANILSWESSLDVARSGAGRDGDATLINLTIPIKLPRTLERIIGRGEKTNIRISGREHISIGGESTKSNKFVANERRTSQSLFPSLDMEQNLQINLSGQIGEKIHIEVDHNSEAIGPEATKIRLYYEGSEDEIIQTIESGDVGLTLPGSQLLGYSSNKSGLFGLKVTGQLGRAEFTVVASKQKAETSSQSFNSSGGTVGVHEIAANRYLNNRFFRLDLPVIQAVAGWFETPDVPGRAAYTGTEKIDLNSIQVFRFMGSIRPGENDVRNIVAIPDSTGRWTDAFLAEAIANQPAGMEEGEWWRQVEYELLTDVEENVVAIDLKREYDWNDLLAVIYRVVDADGNLVYKVGDYPGQDEADRVRLESGDDALFYRMKLLKTTNPGANPHTWQYVLRNIYPLGGTNIDQSTFQFSLEYNVQSQFPNLVTDQQAEVNGELVGIEWFQVFGLDRENQQGEQGADGLADFHDAVIFDFARGILKFPLDFPHPFASTGAEYEAIAPAGFTFVGSDLQNNLMPKLYEPTNSQTDISLNNDKFRFVVKHAAASSSFNLGVSNIEEGSESVTLDGSTLVRDVDYSIDYTFGEITLKGDAAARLSADSNIGVNYQYAPFIGGGNSSLLGMNLGYELSRESRLSTTLLWESNQVVGQKAKLGEEPSRTLVGNVNGQFQFKPEFLTSFANLLSRRDSDRESTVQLSGEMAVSMPNPNTFDDAHVEDFEGVDSSDLMPISRLSWNSASAPVHDQGLGLTADHPDYIDLAYLLDTEFDPAHRLETRWFLPKEPTLRRHLNPDLKEQEGRETQQVLQVHLRTENDQTPWTPQNWGGIMRGLSRSGVDLTKTQFLEFWVNDFRHDVLGAEPTGTLHFDFGNISEDFYWRDKLGSVEYGEFNREDGIVDGTPDGIFTQSEGNNEDIGLGGDQDGYDRYNVDYGVESNPYPSINGTAGNFREDTEDLDGDTRFDEENGYYTLSVNLADSALVDVLRDFPASEVGDNIDEQRAWRKYRIRLGDLLPVSPAIAGSTPSLATVTHMRIWFEDQTPEPGQIRRDLQLSEVKFLGSRWEREGVRKLATIDAPQEQLLEPAERGSDEGFFLGEVNNKENPDYDPPFELYVLNNIPEKESSLVLDYRNLEHQHLARVSRIVSPRGDDYTRYSKLSYYIYNPDPDQADMDIFFRVGADTLNYYEVNYRFDESPGVRSGWHQLQLDMGELSNAKLEPRDAETGWIHTEIRDAHTGRPYRVRVVGYPDLRRVKRFYFGVRNTDRTHPASGYFWFNDVKLREVKRDIGMAQRAALRVNMANQINFDLDWAKQDAEFHGLNKPSGQGFTNEDWKLSTGFTVDDFVPLLGFRMPISLGRQRTTKKPKYVTNSDIEILDEALRQEEMTIDERENFSVRLARRQPSTFFLLRYMLDPWQFSINGSRSTNSSPLLRADGYNLSSALSYDLRLPPNNQLGRLPLFGFLPVIKAINPLPTNISLSGNYADTFRESSNLQPATGEFASQPVQKSRNGVLNAKIDAKPLPVIDIGLTLRSDRDLYRPQEVMGFNIGQEKILNQQVQLRFTPPSRLGLPDTWLGRPVTAFFKEFRALKPGITFNGTFVDDHSPSIRQEGDPFGISNIRNSGDWNLTMNLPLGEKMSQLFPKKIKVQDDERQRVLRDIQNKVRRGTLDDPELQSLNDRLNAMGINDRERQRLEDQLVELARQIEADQRSRLTGSEADSLTVVAAEEGGGVSIPNPLSPLMNVLRGVQPISLSWTRKQDGGYTRFTGRSSFWYSAGLMHDLEAPDSLYVGRNQSERVSKKAATKFKFSRWVNLDVKYDETESHRQQAGQSSRDFTRNWPDLGLSLSGIEKLGFLGGGGQDAVIRSSNFDLTYKQNYTVNGETAIQSNPRTTVQIGPRWTMNFRSGLSATLNLNLTDDESETNATLSRTSRMSVNAQVRHTFGAERLLSKLGLYKPGNPPKVNMTVDMTFSNDSIERWLPLQDRAGEPNTITGAMRLSIAPSFSYNITRNLSGAMRVNYGRDKTKESDTVTQRFGLGVEATFTF